MAESPRRGRMFPQGRGPAPARSDEPAEGAAPPLIAMPPRELPPGGFPRSIGLLRAVEAGMALGGLLVLFLVCLALLTGPGDAEEDEVVAVTEAEVQAVASLPPMPRVRRAAAPVARTPADAVVELPPGRARFLGGWFLVCEQSSYKPPVTTGSLSPDQTRILIPMVPPVSCRVRFTNGSQSAAVTAGSRVRCTWDQQLQC